MSGGARALWTSVKALLSEASVKALLSEASVKALLSEAALL